MREAWDIEKFNNVNLPTVVGEIEIPNFNGTRVLDMPIKMAGDYDYRFPNIVKPFASIIIEAIMFEKNNYGDLKDHYVYVTIDQKVVKKGLTGRRPGAHSDAFIVQNGKQVDVTAETAHLVDEVSHTYIAYDVLPTEFFENEFPIKSVDCDDVMKTFDEIANESKVVTYPCNTLLMMNPYVVHRSAVSHKDTERTFIKVSISKKKYAREGNTKNPFFNYDWSLKKRSKETRNHPW